MGKKDEERKKAVPPLTHRVPTTEEKHFKIQLLQRRENQDLLQELLLRTSWSPTAQGCTITSSSSTSDRNPTNRSSNFFRIS
ncbi:hypothetical protein BDQ17DRAFT_1383961 [Cyathus striatus]|nr:hypothetical protein BDQ17DRAFT_1383961 [Cyathus striatus]